MALNSTAVAAVTLQKNSVLSRHIKDGQVRRPDLAKDAVDGSKVKDATLQAGDFVPGQLPAGPQGAQGETGQRGEQGIQGIQGPKGDTGPPGAPNPNADLLDNLDSSAFALSGHDHDSDYVKVGEDDIVGDDMIVNPSRTIPIPLTSFIECQTNAGAFIDFSSGADAFPDFVNDSTDGEGFQLVFDATAGSADQDVEVCSQFMLPDDFVAGATLRLDVSRGGAEAPTTEQLRCAMTAKGATTAPATASVTVSTTLNQQLFFCSTPGNVTLNPGDVVSFYIAAQGANGGTIDNAIEVFGAGIRYVAKQ